MTKDWVKFIQEQYEPETGFLWQLRKGNYAEHLADRFFEGLESIQFEGPLVDRELVALLWQLTVFVWTQVERAEHLGVNQEQFRSVLDRVIDVLGSSNRMAIPDP